MDRLTKICDRAIRYSFYALFLLVPLAFTDKTSELFEFNKMWLTFGLTIIIGASWIVKSIAQKKLNFKRTPLDIPILLFLLSQLISTVFSWDTHVSIWGYYSRFNGGFLSLISYVFLYYAFVSNFTRGGTDRRAPDSAHGVRSEARLAGALAGGKSGTGPRADFEQNPAIAMVMRLLFLSLISGLIVALWGLPSHFGYDPTCLLFRGSLDVSCWTEAFQPKVRIFSTLGQPDWLAAYLAILIPIAIFMFINSLRKEDKLISISQFLNKKNNKLILLATCYLLLTVLFYLDLLYTGARSGFIAIWIALAFLSIGYLFLERIKFREIFKKKFLLSYWYLLVVLVFIGSITFIVGTPVSQLNKATLPGIKDLFSKPSQTWSKPKAVQTNSNPQKEIGGTSSVKIRQIVWRGAIDAWKNNPIFGTGVETFAFAYYRYRPVEQNLTSEWDFLYNKAHNEFLNYLATTGIIGLGTYLFMIGWFLLIVFKELSKKNYTLYAIPYTLTLALIAGYISILATNFASFSVVITNIYLFLIPAFVFILLDIIPETKAEPKINKESKISGGQWVFISLSLFASLFLLFNLIRFWQADTAYALGYNLDRVNQYQQAYSKLQEAVSIRGDEPMFKDEFSINNAILASAFAEQKEATTASTLANEAINISNQLTEKHPNNIVFAKTRVRIFYALSQLDPRFLPQALSAILRAKKLAPTDAKISYNLGLLYGQNGETQQAVNTLEETVKLKPDYRDAYYALGLFYRDLAVDKNGKVIKPELEKKAVETMKYLLKISEGKDEPAQKALKSWGE